ncbi:MAG: type II secretion system protein GspL, partial [Gammaproteobacteria bacterium]|nr:type II secretion system protein GspL [Gammaproteobacteria bacterium]
LAPATEVLALEAELPARAGARAAQLVPYALEEQLANDIESQHFAIGPTTESGRTAVAVVARALLDDWLAQLAAAGIVPELLCSEAALLPRLAGYAVALLDGDMLLLAAGDGGPPLALSAPEGGFAAALAAALGAAAPSTQLLLHASPGDWERRAAEIEGARAQLGGLKAQLLGSGPLPWLAAQLQDAAPINLLQGRYLPRNTFSAGWARWRVAAALAGALLLLHAGSQLWSLRRLERAAGELDSQIIALAGPQFAGASNSIRPRLEASLRDSNAAGGRTGFLPALQSLAQAVGSTPGTRVQSLNFRDGQLQLKIRAGDARSIDRINQSLRAAGWRAELTSSTSAGDGFEGNIELRGGSSG